MVAISRVYKPVLEPKDISIVWYQTIHSNWRECVINVDEPVEVRCRVFCYTAYGCDVMTKRCICYILRKITWILLSCLLEELEGCGSIRGSNVHCWYHILVCEVSKTQSNGNRNESLIKNNMRDVVLNVCIFQPNLPSCIFNVFFLLLEHNILVGKPIYFSKLIMPITIVIMIRN